MSISKVEAYLRSAEFVQRPSGVKRLIYMRLPHPAVHEKHGHEAWTWFFVVRFLFPVCEFVQPRGQASEGACEEDVTTWRDPAVRNEETLKRFCGREFS